MAFRKPLGVIKPLQYDFLVAQVKFPVSLHLVWTTDREQPEALADCTGPTVRGNGKAAERSNYTANVKVRNGVLLKSG